MIYSQSIVTLLLCWIAALAFKTVPSIEAVYVHFWLRSHKYSLLFISIQCFNILVFVSIVVLSLEYFADKLWHMSPIAYDWGWHRLPCICDVTQLHWRSNLQTYTLDLYARHFFHLQKHQIRTIVFTLIAYPLLQRLVNKNAIQLILCHFSRVLISLKRQFLCLFVWCCVCLAFFPHCFFSFRKQLYIVVCLTSHVVTCAIKWLVLFVLRELKGNIDCAWEIEVLKF